MRQLINVAQYLVLGSVAACAAESNPVVDTTAGEDAIRTVDQRLLDAAQARDAAGFASAFAPDGFLLFPNSRTINGREAIQAHLERDFAAPDFMVSWEAAKYIVAESGDLAASIGTYQLSVTTPDGPLQDHGKYMTLWRKVEGQWRVAADMINTDVPLPEPPGM